MVGAVIKYGTIVAAAVLVYGLKSPGSENTIGTIECGSGENNSISTTQPGIIHVRDGERRAGQVHFAKSTIWGMSPFDLGFHGVTENRNYSLLLEGAQNKAVGGTTVYEVTREGPEWTSPDEHVAWLVVKRDGPELYRASCKER